MRESAITTGQTIEILRNDENAAAWARSYMKSTKLSWQRSEAVQGLIACARLHNIGAWDFISLDEGTLRKDARLVINGMPYSITAIGQ